MSYVRVQSLESLTALKAALCTFAAQAKEALSAIDMEIRRMQDWLDEQAKFWRHTVQECEEEVFLAKQELARRRILKMGDRPPDCTEQEKALALARRRLAHAEDKLETTQRWRRQYPEAVHDFEGPVGQLVTVLEADLPKADALLEHKIATLDAYVQIAAPPRQETKPGA